MKLIISIVVVAVLVVLMADMSTATAASSSQKESDIHEIIENYAMAKMTASCEKVRKYAQKINNALINCMPLSVPDEDINGCKIMDSQSTALDYMKHVICKINNEFSDREKIALLCLATLYALFLLMVGIVTAFIFTLILMVLNSCLFPEEKTKSKRKTIKVHTFSPMKHTVYSNIPLVAPPPPRYHNV